MVQNPRIKYVVSFTAAAMLSLGMPAMSADLVIGEPGWPTAKATAHVIKEFLEREAGIKSTIIAASNPIVFGAMERGKGDIDINTEVWLPNNQALVEKYVDENQTVILSSKPYESQQGFCVNREFGETHGIKSIYDLADPEISKLFDTDNDGKGEFWLGGSGWSSTAIAEIKARDYGFGEFFELHTLDEALAMAKLASSLNTNKGFVGYCYTPNHVFQLYDLVMLEEPPYDESKWNVVSPTEDPDWLDKSSVPVAFPPATLHFAWSATLKDRHPEAARLINNIQLTGEDVATWLYALAVEKQDADELAKAWLDDNPEKVESWRN